MFYRLNRLVLSADTEGAAPVASTADDGSSGSPAVSTEAAAEPSLLTQEAAAGVEGASAAAANSEEKKDETPPEEKKDEAPPEPMKPEDYEIELPEGISADDPMLSAFLEHAASKRMDNEAVQEIVSVLGPKLAEKLAEPARAWKTMNDAWVQEVRADPEIGGEKWDGAKSTIQAAIKLVTPPGEIEALGAALDMTGAGNNPHVIRALHRMASRLVEQGAVSGGAPAPSPSKVLASMYPSAAQGG